MNGHNRVEWHTQNLKLSNDIIQENREYMESIIKKCEEKNVSVLLLTTPVCSTYYACADSAQFSLMIETCEEMTQKYNNVQYLNLFRDSRFVEEDFFFSFHLETDGAVKLTKILDEYISDLSSFSRQ